MALSQPYHGSLTVSTTELSLVSGTNVLQSNTTAGVYQLFLDLSALAAGDSFRVRIKEKVNAGTQGAIEDATIAGAVGLPIYASPSLLLLDGWDMTIINVEGTARIIPYSIRQVA